MITACWCSPGRSARDVLSQCTKTDLSNAAFRWLTGKMATVAGVDGVRLLRVNYVGELGWELHVPMAGMPKVFDALMAAGKPHGIRLFGTYAMNSLRMEKAYRGWGSELTTEIDMIEASMERFLRLDKEDFIGKAAHTVEQAARPPHEARLHGGRQHGFGLHGQRAGLCGRQGGGRHHLGRLRPQDGQVAGLRLCAAGDDGGTAPSSTCWSSQNAARRASFPSRSGIRRTSG